MPTPSFTDIIREYLESQFSGGGGGGGGGGDITVDTEMSATSTNPVQNKVITAALALKAAIADIPTKVSQLLNDSGYQNVAQVQSAITAAVPTKVSDLTNDSGYQTAAQVQAAIATLQTKAITDTGGYFSTDTVDGALQEIGAELAGVNTLIGTGVIT